MVRAEIVAWLARECPDNEFVLLDGHDDAFLGVSALGPNTEEVAVYDQGKIIRTLVEEEKMSLQDAVDWYTFDMLTIGPIFVSLHHE